MKYYFFLKKCLEYFKNSYYDLIVKIDESQRQIKTFGTIFFINYPLYYLIWKFASVQSYENLFLRISASLLCLPLIFIDKIKVNFNRYVPAYWYFTVMYCLPFFFFFMTLHNHGSAAWLLNLLLEIFLTFLLFDVLGVIGINTLGFALGWGIYTLIEGNKVVFMPSTIDIFGALSTIAATFVVGGIFAQNKAYLEKEKLKTMKSLGATIAHEIRTPLTAIKFGITGAKDYFPSLVNAYLAAKAHHLKIEPIQTKHLHILSSVFDTIETEINYANTIINMTLMNVKQTGSSKIDFKAYSMRACIEEALQRYPFKKGERQLIEWSNKEDFLFHGDKILMIHVLFNLIKNSLYYIEVANKGKIQISYRATKYDNILIFKDTAQGIPAEVLPRLFERFYTTARHGTGLGLAFCKVVLTNFGGTITCQSTYAEFTQFTMTFPKIKT